jgi:hypothetical protein
MLDPHEPPYRASLDLLLQLRTSDAARERVQLREAHEEERGTYDAHELERARLAHILLLYARPDDLPLLRFLLDQEIAARRSDDFQGAGDTLTILSMLLAEHGDASDTGRFWRAKRANFDCWAGGYDIEFVLTWLTPAEALEQLEEREMLEGYDLEAVQAGLGGWRAALARRHPRSLEAMTPMDGEIWAELFEDMDGLLRYGLANAETPEARARLYARLGRHAEAVSCWREAAAAAEGSWDKISRLTNAVSDAAQIPLPSTAEVLEIDRLRAEIPGWFEVGLGRMATEACYRLAAAVDEPDCGRVLWQLAQGWRQDLESFSLVGLQIALVAGERWGEVHEQEQLREEIVAERARIGREMEALGSEE